MHKFTLFTVILSIITVSIVIEMVVNGYSLSKDYIPPQEEEELEVVETSDLKKKTATPPTIKVPAVKTEDATEAESVNESPEETVSLYGFIEKNTINTELLTQIGIIDGKIKEVSIEKPYLQAISLTENVKNRLKVVNLFDFEEYLGTIYELHFLNLKEAEQFYSDMKAESLKVTDAEIRETNTFGDASFYLNRKDKTKTAFSVVRIGADVYGFEYPHGSHQMFKDLAEKLVNQQ